jgi:hypothetical protein
MTDLKVLKYDPDNDENFENCLNLESLQIVYLNHPNLLALQKISALSAMSCLSKLILSRVKVLPTSLAAFDHLFALKVLEFAHCKVECNWTDFGVSLAQTPVKNLIFRNIHCHVDHIESLLASVRLDFLYLSNFKPLTSESSIDVFRTFADAFHCKRDNPAVSFLIEQDGFARNHNGAIIKQSLS